MLHIENDFPPVHFPDDPDKFEFDEEVTEVFDDMASRSIPMYGEARALTVSLTIGILDRQWAEGEEVRILDIGASTGAYFKALWKGLGYDATERIPNLTAVAIDSSLPMVERMLKDLPAVSTLLRDATALEDLPGKFDIVNIAYLVQFIPVNMRKAFWRKVYEITAPKGIVIVSGKYLPEYEYQGFFADEYIGFRLANGYSQQEIDAKTRALDNSMWPETVQTMISNVQEAGFLGCQDICRWLQFATTVLRK